MRHDLRVMLVISYFLAFDQPITVLRIRVAPPIGNQVANSISGHLFRAFDGICRPQHLHQYSRQNAACYDRRPRLFTSTQCHICQRRSGRDVIMTESIDFRNTRMPLTHRSRPRCPYSGLAP